MTDPRYNNLDITPTQVALELLNLSRELAEAVSDFDEIEQAVVDAEQAFVLAESEAMLRCRSEEDLPSADLRKAWVAQQVWQPRLAFDTAKAIVRARKVRIDAIKSRVTIGQTVTNALQSELDLQRVRSR
jgi:hypothetical protein